MTVSQENPMDLLGGAPRTDTELDAMDVELLRAYLERYLDTPTPRRRVNWAHEACSLGLHCDGTVLDDAYIADVTRRIDARLDVA